MTFAHKQIELSPFSKTNDAALASFDREQTINKLETLSELFLKNLIIECINNTYFFSSDKTLMQDFCRYLREHWKNISKIKIHFYLNKLLDDGDWEVRKLVESNIELYAVLQLRIQSLKQYTIKTAHCYNPKHTKHLEEMLEKYKTTGDTFDLSQIRIKLKKIIMNFFISPIVQYSSLQFREGIIDNQLYLMTHIKKTLDAIENSMPPGYALTDSHKRILSYIYTLENERLDSKNRAGSFITLYSYLRDYMKNYSIFPLDKEQMNLVKKLAEMVQNLDELKESAERSKLTYLNVAQVPEYARDYLEEDYLEVITSWTRLTTQQLEMMPPKKIEVENVPVINEFKRRTKPAQTISGDTHEETKSDYITPEVPVALQPKESKRQTHSSHRIVSQALIPTNILADEKINIPTYRDSPFVAKKLDDAAQRYLNQLIQHASDDNWGFEVKDCADNRYSLKELFEKALLQYRTEGMININLLKNAVKAIENYYKYNDKEARPLPLKRTIDNFEKLSLCIKNCDYKNEKAPLMKAEKRAVNLDYSAVSTESNKKNSRG